MWLSNGWGAVLMDWDAAFFAQSKLESLIWDEDPGDHPLMDNVPTFLQIRAARSGTGIVFATRRPQPEPEPKPISIGVVRNGRRRAAMPLNLSA